MPHAAHINTRPETSPATATDRVICCRIPGAGLVKLGRRGYARVVLPWLILAIVAVPLVVVGFAASRRRTEAGERPAGKNAQGLTEQEVAEAESYEAKWREEDEERFHRERLP